MTSTLQINDQKAILVFLPNGVAQVIVSKLIEHGYAATAVFSVPELFDALRSDRHSLAVTTRPDIDMVRNIKSMPVVNLEVFFHTVVSSGGMVSSSKQFDGKAFLQRIKALHEPRVARGAILHGKPATDTNLNARARQMSGWWTAARALFSGRMPAGAKD
ncbi:hypothetical protein ADU59_25305 [Pararhizobium polonicum]|uniref:Uncharacterized protein n=1 Tax=Pararhizobium polonicum TaxID=1612624 RepID=A0A1C7NUM0_9HYPH|nr:hypothetical protein [Pararhizobium polonicum]OBZ92703.1 hypothetical protein ADU59_25305 [Pararhizobium polonicum]